MDEPTTSPPGVEPRATQPPSEGHDRRRDARRALAEEVVARSAALGFMDTLHDVRSSRFFTDVPLSVVAPPGAAPNF